MKFSSKRLLAAVLAFVLVLSLFPVTQPMHVHAATALTTSVDGLTASWDYNSNNKNGNYTASGNSITGTATGGLLNRTTIVLTLTNGSDGEATLKFTYSKSGGTLSGAISSASGTYEAVLAKGASVTINFQSGRNQTNTLSITDISLISTSAADPNLTFKPGANGSYTVDGTAVTAETKMTVSAGTELALVATPASGYQFYGWQKADGTYVSQNASYTLTASADVEITPVFISSSVALFGVGQTKYDNLTEAGKAAAAGTNKTIILLNNGTVSGSHTIPAGTTLLIPYDDANTAYGASASCTSWTSFINGNGHIAWESPSAYRTLTLAGDANITVNGNIEVGGRHAAAGGKLGTYGGSPTGKLGYINMLSGSHIDLNSGANLFCWGYVYGDGTITAKNGASIYENFQIMDFRGGSVTSELASSYLVFPLSQYYVQNVEVATRYEYGAAEYIATSIFMSNQCHSATVKFIGADAMFQPTSGSYFVKDYNPATDMLEMHAYGDSVMASMNLELGGTAIDSSTFVLPITNNIQINLHSGTTTLKQNMMLLPGSSLTVGKDAILNLAYTDQTGDVVTAGGHVLQIFDSENWFKGLNMDTLETVNGLYYIHPSKNFAPLEYTCTARKIRTVADLTDVTLDINGKVITEGFLYSTVTWADAVNEDFTIVSGGANIISSEKTGMVIMNNGAGQDQLGYLFSQSDATYYYIPLASVQLKNGDGTLLDTTYAEAGTEYHYCAPCDCWYTGEHTCAPAKVEITWIINGEATAQEFDYNVIPSCDLNPAKAYDANAHYVFKGWATTENGAVLATLPNATSDAAYYAVFEAVAHNYTNETARTDATCMAEGSVTKQCTCDATETTTLPIDKDNHTGNNTTGVNAKEPTCGEEGYTGDTVCECGATVAYGTSIPATGNHNYINETARTDATCMAEGSVTKQCACCATETTTLPIDKDNHTGNNTTGVNAQVPTCGAEGYTGDTVCECGQTVAYGTSIPATGNHNYTNEIARTDATCMAEGSVTKQCACGATETTTLPIDKDNHTGKNTTGVNAQVPTCGAEGYTGDTVCECGQTVAYGTSIPATGNHNYTNEIARTDATCMAEGSVTKQCACGATETTTLPIDKDNHTGKNTTGVNAKVPTCDEEGYTGDTVCECGATVAYGTSISANGHTNGTPVTENEVPADCDDAGSYDTVIYCSVCGDEVSRTTTTIPATGHSHVDGKCACGDIIPVTLPGSFNDWNGYEMTWNEGGYYTYSMRLDDGNYTFKVIENGSWLGNNGTIVDQTHGYEWIFGDGGDCILNASGGTYTFTYNINTNGLKVDAVLDHVHSYSTTYTWGNYYATCEAAHRCDCGISYTEECVVTSSAGNDGVYFTANSSQGLESAFVEHVGENYAIYFDNTVINWANVNAYVWNNDNGEALVNWPGSAMTDMGNGLYKIVIPAGYDMIIFNDGSNQTADISMPDSYANVAVYNSIYKTCSWGYKTPESVKVTYVVDGKEVDSLDDLYYGSKFDAKFEDFYVYKPSKEGHHFSGYDYTNATDYLTGDVTFYGSMLPNWYGVYLIVDGVRYDYWVAAFGTPLNLPVPTKDQNGCTIYTFSGWNEEIPSTMPAHDVTFTGSFIEGKSHTAGTPVIENEVAADCTNEGSYDTVIYCSVCGDEASRVTTTVSSTGHTAGDVVVEDEVDASCTVDGSYCNVVYCVDCGEELSHDTVIVPATGHSETDLSYNPYGDGTHDVICNVCGDISEEKATCSYVDHMCKYCEDLERMTVVFMNGDEVFTSASCGYGETLNFYGMPIPVAPEGHAWAGWYTEDGVKVEPGMTLTTNLVAYATWTKQSYTLTVYVLATGDVVELSVPYGASLPEILAQAAEDGKIPAIGDEFRVINNYENGMYFISGYSHYNEAEGGWINVNEAFTMPAADIDIDQDWRMLTGWINSDVDGDGIFDGTEYYDCLSESLYLTGWQYIEEDYDDIPGGAWYYFTSYITENGISYHFRAEGISRVPYNTELGYGPDQETLDYAQANGIEFIDATTGLFVFDENGKFQMNYTGPVIDGEYARYAVNGHIAWHVGLVENQGAYFYFIGDEVNGGNIMATGDVYVIRNTSDFNAVIGGIYTFDVDGSLKIFHGIVENDLFEGKRYYVAGRLMIGYGLCDITEKVNGEWVTNYFYVRSDGTLAVNTRYWVAKTNGIDFAVGEYEFDENGFMIIPVEEPAKDGIYFENGAWYYYENGSIGYNKGLIFTDKSWYDADGNDVWGEGGIIYVRSNGKLATGTYYVTNLSNYSQIVDVVAGTPLQFSDMGLMGGLKNGIIDGYYYVNNQIAYAAGLIEIDGNYYYVRSNGQVIMGRDYWISNANDTGIKLGCYTFDENGVMQLPDTYGFTGIKDGYYYVDGAVAYGAGLVMLDDGTYIYVRSNGQLAVGKYWPTSLNGYLPVGEYDFGEDGILTVE